MTTMSPSFSPFPYNCALRSSGLPPIARHVAMTLVTYANRSGEAWPTKATLEDGTGWARRFVNTALNTLVLERRVARRGWDHRSEERTGIGRRPVGLVA